MVWALEHQRGFLSLFPSLGVPAVFLLPLSLDLVDWAVTGGRGSAGLAVGGSKSPVYGWYLGEGETSRLLPTKAGTYGSTICWSCCSGGGSSCCGGVGSSGCRCCWSCC